MTDDKIADTLKEIAATLDKCADDVPYELSAKENIYFRMTALAEEARALAAELKK